MLDKRSKIVLAIAAGILAIGTLQGIWFWYLGPYIQQVEISRNPPSDAPSDLFEFHNIYDEVVLTIQPTERFEVSENLAYAKQYGDSIWGSGTIQAKECLYNHDAAGIAQIHLFNPQRFIDEKFPNGVHTEQYKILTDAAPLPEKRKLGKYEYYYVPPASPGESSEGWWILNTDKGLLKLSVVLGGCAEEKVSKDAVLRLLESIELKANIK